MTTAGLCEDDNELRRDVQRALERAGYAVRATASGTEALHAFADDPPDVLVLDIGLPDADGRDVCQALRAQGVSSPVLFLTARDAITDRLSGFSVGGDDYLTKPFDFAELVARLQALLRRSGSNGVTTVGDLRLDPATHAASCGERTVPMTPTEFRLLGALAARPTETLRRLELVRAGWPHGAVVHDNTLDVYVARLRRKLRELGSSAELRTVHGVGYQLR
jgi:two-component system, OmpR family, response regulator